MAGEKKLSQRDDALVRVLDRLSDDIKNQELLLDDLRKRQADMGAGIERTLALQFTHQDTTDRSIEKSNDAINRYRSDMLTLVHEQDRLNEILKELGKKQTAIAFSQDNLTNSLNNLSRRLEAAEKTVRDLSEYSQKHDEAFARQLDEIHRNLAKLHADTEKRVGEMQKATQRRLDEIRHDTMHRLQALDSIETSLDVLLVRTQPREKKPFIAARLYRRLRAFIMGKGVGTVR